MTTDKTRTDTGIAPFERPATVAHVLSFRARALAVIERVEMPDAEPPPGGGWRIVDDSDGEQKLWERVGLIQRRA